MCSFVCKLSTYSSFPEYWTDYSQIWHKAILGQMKGHVRTEAVKGHLIYLLVLNTYLLILITHLLLLSTYLLLLITYLLFVRSELALNK